MHPPIRRASPFRLLSDEWALNRRGIVLPAALLILLALGFIATGAAQQSLMAVRVAVNHDAYQRAFNAAEGALARGVEALAASYEAGTAPPDSSLLVADSLGAVAITARCYWRREPAGRDLDGDGVPGEVVRYDRAWGYASATRAGDPLEPGEPVRLIVASARGRAAAEDVLIEVGLERDPTITDERARGAWRVVPLRWSAIVGHR